MPPLNKRRRCDPVCPRGHAPRDRLALAATLCAARGAHLTAARRQILELLWKNDRPTGAYELIDALNRRDSRPIAPPTVYRALEFLIAQRLVTKVESRNAYVPCAHPERRHNCLFFICHKCGASAELEDERIEGLLAENAAALGYRAIRRVIEVEGTCPTCIAAGTLKEGEHGNTLMSA